MRENDPKTIDRFTENALIILYIIHKAYRIFSSFLFVLPIFLAIL